MVAQLLSIMSPSSPTTINVANATISDSLVLVVDPNKHKPGDFNLRDPLNCTYKITGNGLLLPITLIDFQARYNKVAKNVAVQWKVESAESDLKYVVERSGDGTRFIEVGLIPGIENKNEYSFNDNSTVATRLYYRLKLIAKDGKVSYSKIVLVNTSKETTIRLYPNPATDKINIIFDSQTSEEAEISLISILGNKVSEKKYQINYGNNKVSINISSLPKGTYYIKVTMQKSNERFIRKIIVN